MGTVEAPPAARPWLARMATDEALARRAAAGDVGAFTAIHARYGDQLFRYCGSIVRDSEDAADAFQSTMLRAFNALQGERRRLDLKPWLYRIAHNESISLIRRRRDFDSLSHGRDLLGGDVVADADVRDRIRRLVRDFADLSERQRAAVVMRELGGLDYADVATVLGTSLDAAKRAVSEARAALVAAEAGRELDCASIRAVISEHDGRMLRSRRIRAHLADCGPCRGFKTGLPKLSEDLAFALPPAPMIAASGLLATVLGVGGGAAGTSGVAGAPVAGAVGSGLGGAFGGVGLGAGLTGKAVATVAAAAMALGAASYVELEARGERSGAAGAQQDSSVGSGGGRGYSPTGPPDSRLLTATAARGDGRAGARGAEEGLAHRADSPVPAPGRTNAGAVREQSPARNSAEQNRPDHQSQGLAQGDADGSPPGDPGEPAASGVDEPEDSPTAERRLADLIARQVNDMLRENLGDLSSGVALTGDVDTLVGRSLDLARTSTSGALGGGIEADLSELIGTYADDGLSANTFERRLSSLLGGFGR